MNDPVMSGRIRRVGGGVLPTPGGEPLGSLSFSVMGDQAFNRPLMEALVTAGFQVFTQRTNIRLGDEEASLSLAQRQVEAVFWAAPTARIFVSVYLSHVGSWSKTHPGECYETSEGEACCMNLDGERYGLALPGSDARRLDLIHKHRFVSPFSSVFIEDSVTAILDLLSRLKLGPAAPNIAGLFIGAHSTSEWNIFTPGGDFSFAALAGFRRHLMVKYGTDTALHAAWGRTDMSLATALPPSEVAVLRDVFCRFEDPRARDYTDACTAALAGQFATIAGTVRKHYPELMIGGFWAGLEWHQGATEQVLEAADFIATPLSYENRHAGGSACSQNPIADSLPVRNRFLWDELDTRTHISNDANARYGRPRSEQEAVELIWRDGGQTIIQGHYGWWFDFGEETGHRSNVAGADWIPGSWYSTPALLKALAGVNAVYAKAAKLDRTPIHEIRIFSPINAPARIANNMIQQAQRATEWCRVGGSFGAYALDDLLTGRVNLGKLNVFALCQSLSEREIAALNAVLANSGVTVVWLNGSGLVAPDGRIAPDSQRSSGLTGIRQRFVRNGPRAYDPGLTPDCPSSAITFHAVLEPAAHPALRSLEAGNAVGQADRDLCSSLDQMYVNPTPGKPCSPMPRPMSVALEICDPEATVFARFSHTGTGAAAVKDVHGYTSVVYNCHHLPARLLREWARFSGVHIYAESDTSVWATRGLLLVHAAQAGPLKIRLPEVLDLTDLRTQVLHHAVDQLRLEAFLGQTFFYKLGKHED